ncbi:MAG: HD-GYP domain-containing protein, partial [Ktedonobacterales bacterium]
MNSANELVGAERGGASNEALLRAYAGVLTGLAVGLGILLHVSGQFVINDPGTVVALSIVALLVERQSVAIADHVQMSISVLPILFAALALGPGAAMIVGASSLLLDCRRPFKRWLIWTGGRASIAGLAGLLKILVIGTGTASLGRLLLGGFVIAAFEGCSDASLTGMTLKLRGAGGFSETVATMSQVLTTALPLYAPLLAVVAYTYQVAGSWAGLLVLILSLAAQRLFVMYREQRQLASQLTAALLKLERVSFSFAAAMVAALDARDHYTAGHSAAVAVYARDIAEQLGLPPQDQECAHLCGLLHDVGKIGIPTELLEKRGPLTHDERLAIEMHSEIGAAILRRVEGYSEIALAVRHHHERVDGTGYPSQTAAQEIPVLSRIVAVADAYSAMTSERPYRDALPSAEAKTRIELGSGSQFDSAVVAAFLTVLEQSNEA